LTGYSNNHVLEIGTGINEMIKKKLDVIDKINNFDNEKEMKLKDLRKKIKKNKGTEKRKLIEKRKKLENHQLTENRKRKIINKKYKKIKDIVNDIHKKVANYLTSKFGSVIIGNLSTKATGEDKRGNKMAKRIGNMLSIFKFKEFLKYKCKSRGVSYKETDESYTTQCCGKCGWRNVNIKGDKIFKCKDCGIKIGRDVNSSRLILISSL
jgi:IS605 OrfB family transposase